MKSIFFIIMEVQRFKRYPTVHCWIKHILEAVYSAEDKSFHSIFGKIKRVRILATILDKREILSVQNDNFNSDFENDLTSTSYRIEFDLDDATGQIRAVIWGADPKNYEEFKKGDLVEIVGLLRKWKDFITLSPEIIKKVDDPNLKLLRDAEVIKRLKFGELFEIPEDLGGDTIIDEIPATIDVDSLFESDESDSEDNSIKERIYQIIKESTDAGKGIKFNTLIEKIKISAEDLRKYLSDLIIESKIYQSDEDIYESF
ncbi:MAG: OB-fold nucleic acid binding domain-containing protein [Promethearchaeota archaeon]